MIKGFRVVTVKVGFILRPEDYPYIIVHWFGIVDVEPC